MKIMAAFIVFNILVLPVTGAEYHVSIEGNDQNTGAIRSPLRTISEAAKRAQPGDIITVHEGVYRERINPPRGGTSENMRIVYQAAEGEKVTIKGSERITGWEKVEKKVWKVTLPNTFFKDYNPYQDLITGDWFDARGRIHHTGEVFLNEKSLYEKATLAEVMNPVPWEDSRDTAGSLYTWYCEYNEQHTTIWANFKDADPNHELVEISVRKACFYPDTPGRNFITVRGFHLSQAASQWAAPTAEQIGLIGTHWSKGWIIENNIISNSKCTGITLGKERATGHNVWSNNRNKDGAIHYNEVIFRALRIGWSRENTGSHLVRHNIIHSCEQAGICGSLGAAFSTISNNHIYDIWTKRQFRGAEIGGIKLHAAIDVLIQENRIHNSGRGLWMDWMAQGTRISRNLCYDNTTDDLFVEVNHGPFLADNNLFLSDVPLRDWSEGGAYVHNLFFGMIKQRPSRRYTPYHFPHSTEVAGLINILGGDDRFYNNIFIGKEDPVPPVTDPNERQITGYGLAVYNDVERPMYIDGNAYFLYAKPYKDEPDHLEKSSYNPALVVTESEGKVLLKIRFDQALKDLKTQLVTTSRLGIAMIPEVPYENRDGSSVEIDYDYFGRKRNPDKPTAGPFEAIGEGEVSLDVWKDK